MIKSSVIEILKSFSEEDFKKFEDFLNSPYFNKRSNTLKLYLMIRKYSPAFDHSDLKKEIIWNELFKGKDYNYGTMKNIIYDLNRLCIKYVTLEEFEKSQLEKDELMIRALYKRNISKLITIKFNELEKAYSLRSFKNEDYEIAEYYFYVSRIYWMKYSFYLHSEPKKAREEDLIKYTSMMVYGFILYLIYFNSNIYSQFLDKNFNKDDYIVTFFLNEIGDEIIDKLLEMTKELSDKDFRILKTYMVSSKLFLNSTDENHFLEFKNIITENLDLFGNYDVKGLLFKIFNSSIRFNSPGLNAHNIRIETLNILIRRKLFPEKGRALEPVLLRKYIQSAGELADYEYIEMLLKNYLKFVDEEKRDEVKKYAQIYLHFGDGQFEDALVLISKIEMDSAMLKVQMKILKSRCLYELNDLNTFNYEIDSIKHFLKNNRSLSPRSYNLLYNEVNLIKDLFNLKRDFKPDEFEKLKSNISELGTYSKWVFDKISEIENLKKSKILN